MTDALAPIQEGFRAESCFLFGLSGVGKATVAKAAVRELRQEVLEVAYAYVNCWQDYTRNAVLEQASRDLVGAALPRSVSTGRLIDRITADLDERVTSRISVAYRVNFDSYGEDTITETLPAGSRGTRPEHGRRGRAQTHRAPL